MKFVHQHRCLPDLHTHTHYCGHASGEMEEMVQHAIRLGMPVLGFSDHFYYPRGYQEPLPDCVIAENRFSDYVADVVLLQEKYKDQIQILLGTEVDYLSGLLPVQKINLKQWPLDYVIGSVHLIDDLMIDYSQETLAENIEKMGGVEAMWNEYWSAVEMLIRHDICHVAGHLDLPRKFTAGIIAPTAYIDRAAAVIDLIKDKGMTIDINTGGIARSSEGTLYPGKEILAYAAEKQVFISTGSDAHRPGEAGRFFTETALMLEAMGWQYITCFKGGKAFHSPLLSS